MTGTFKANNSYNSFLLLIYGVMLKLPMFIHSEVPQPNQFDGIFYKSVLNWLQPVLSEVPVFYSVIAFVLLFTQAITFNKMVNDQRIMSRPHYLTGMSYLLITSLFTEWNTLSAPLVMNSLLIWVWYKMSGLYSNQKPKASLFNIGIVIGLCTFFYFPALAFAALIIFGLAITRPFKLAEWLIALLGIITPYYFLLAIVFLTGNWQNYQLPGLAVANPVIDQSMWAYGAIALIMFSGIVGLIYVQQNFRRQLIQARKCWNLTFLYLLVAFFVPFINATHSFEYWILCAVPLSALIAAAFLYPAKNWFPLVLHWLLVALVVLLNYIV